MSTLFDGLLIGRRISNLKHEAKSDHHQVIKKAVFLGWRESSS